MSRQTFTESKAVDLPEAESKDIETTYPEHFYPIFDALRTNFSPKNLFAQYDKLNYQDQHHLFDWLITQQDLISLITAKHFNLLLSLYPKKSVNLLRHIPVDVDTSLSYLKNAPREQKSKYANALFANDFFVHAFFKAETPSDTFYNNLLELSRAAPGNVIKILELTPLQHISSVFKRHCESVFKDSLTPGGDLAFKSLKILLNSSLFLIQTQTLIENHPKCTTLLKDDTLLKIIAEPGGLFILQPSNYIRILERILPHINANTFWNIYLKSPRFAHTVKQIRFLDKIATERPNGKIVSSSNYQESLKDIMPIIEILIKNKNILPDWKFKFNNEDTCALIKAHASTPMLLLHIFMRGSNSQNDTRCIDLFFNEGSIEENDKICFLLFFLITSIKPQDENPFPPYISAHLINTIIQKDYLMRLVNINPEHIAMLRKLVNTFVTKETHWVVTEAVVNAGCIQQWLKAGGENAPYTLAMSIALPPELHKETRKTCVTAIAQCHTSLQDPYQLVTSLSSDYTLDDDEARNNAKINRCMTYLEPAFCHLKKSKHTHFFTFLKKAHPTLFPTIFKALSKVKVISASALLMVLNSLTEQEQKNTALTSILFNAINALPAQHASMIYKLFLNESRKGNFQNLKLQPNDFMTLQSVEVVTPEDAPLLIQKANHTDYSLEALMKGFPEITTYLQSLPEKAAMNLLKRHPNKAVIYQTCIAPKTRALPQIAKIKIIRTVIQSTPKGASLDFEFITCALKDAGIEEENILLTSYDFLPNEQKLELFDIDHKLPAFLRLLESKGEEVFSALPLSRCFVQALATSENPEVFFENQKDFAMYILHEAKKCLGDSFNQSPYARIFAPAANWLYNNKATLFPKTTQLSLEDRVVLSSFHPNFIPYFINILTKQSHGISIACATDLLLEINELLHSRHFSEFSIEQPLVESCYSAIKAFIETYDLTLPSLLSKLDETPKNSHLVLIALALQLSNINQTCQIYNLLGEGILSISPHNAWFGIKFKDAINNILANITLEQWCYVYKTSPILFTTLYKIAINETNVALSTLLRAHLYMKKPLQYLELVKSIKNISLHDDNIVLLIDMLALYQDDTHTTVMPAVTRACIEHPDRVKLIPLFETALNASFSSIKSLTDFTTLSKNLLLYSEPFTDSKHPYLILLCKKIISEAHHHNLTGAVFIKETFLTYAIENGLYHAAAYLEAELGNSITTLEAADAARQRDILFCAPLMKNALLAIFDGYNSGLFFYQLCSLFKTIGTHSDILLEHIRSNRISLQLKHPITVNESRLKHILQQTIARGLFDLTVCITHFFLANTTTRSPEINIALLEIVNWGLPPEYQLELKALCATHGIRLRHIATLNETLSIVLTLPNRFNKKWLCLILDKPELFQERATHYQLAAALNRLADEHLRSLFNIDEHLISLHETDEHDRTAILLKALHTLHQYYPQSIRRWVQCFFITPLDNGDFQERFHLLPQLIPTLSSSQFEPLREAIYKLDLLQRFFTPEPLAAAPNPDNYEDGEGDEEFLDDEATFVAMQNARNNTVEHLFQTLQHYPHLLLIYLEDSGFAYVLLNNLSQSEWHELISTAPMCFVHLLNANNLTFDVIKIFLAKDPATIRQLLIACAKHKCNPMQALSRFIDPDMLEQVRTAVEQLAQSQLIDAKTYITAMKATQESGAVPNQRLISGYIKHFAKTRKKNPAAFTRLFQQHTKTRPNINNYHTGLLVSGLALLVNHGETYSSPLFHAYVIALAVHKSNPPICDRSEALTAPIAEDDNSTPAEASESKGIEAFFEEDGCDTPKLT